MWEEWKRAWQQAVENFRRELGEDGEAQPLAMRRELDAARSAMDRLEREISRVRRDAAQEREQEATCRRREGQARRIGDEETVQLAAEYAVRHAEYALILERKVEVLVAEKALLAKDLRHMEDVLAARRDTLPEASSRTDRLEDREREDREREDREREDRDFSRLEREARERAAEARLEELKRRMR